MRVAHFVLDDHLLFDFPFLQLRRGETSEEHFLVGVAIVSVEVKTIHGLVRAQSLCDELALLEQEPIGGSCKILQNSFIRMNDHRVDRFFVGIIPLISGLPEIMDFHRTVLGRGVNSFTIFLKTYCCHVI